MNEFKSPRHQRSSVKRRNRLTQNSPLRHRLTLGCCAQREIESLTANEVFILQATSRLASDHAVDHSKALNRLAYFDCSHAQQSFASRCCRKGEIFIIEIRRSRLTARSSSLIRRHRGVALNQFYPVKRH